MISSGSETQVKNQRSKARDDTRRGGGTSTSRASRKESRTSDEPTEAPGTSVKAPRYNGSGRDSAHTAASLIDPRATTIDERPNHSEPNVSDDYATSNRDYTVGTDTSYDRKVDARSGTGRGSTLDDKRVRRVDHAQSSVGSHQKSASASSSLVSRSGQASRNIRSGNHDPSQHGSHHPTKRSSEQQSFDSIKDAHHLSKDVGSLGGREGITSLIAMVEKEDYAGFGRSVSADLDLIHNDEFPDTIRQRAVAAIQKEDQRQADGCIKTLALIEVCRTLSYARATYFLLSLIREDDTLVLGEFERACARERQACSNRPEAELQNEDRADQKPARSRNPDRQNRRKREFFEVTVDSRKMPRMLRSDNTREKLKTDFPVQLPPWFILGKLFKMWKMVPRDDEPLPQSSAGSCVVRQGVRTRGQLGSTAPSPSSPLASSPQINRVRRIYYLVVVKQAPEFCLAIRARSYYNSGVSPKDFNPSAIRAHAIIFSKSAEPQSGQPQLLKRPIKVDLAPQEDHLDPAMRVDFERPYTVEYPTCAKEIGKVADESMDCFIQYCKEHTV